MTQSYCQRLAREVAISGFKGLMVWGLGVFQGGRGRREHGFARE